MYEDYDPVYDNYAQGHDYDQQVDFEYDRYSSNKVPEEIRKFLVYFCRAVNEGALYEVQNLYENTWPLMTEQYFPSSPWPDEKTVSEIIHGHDTDDIFLILYKELYYRHIYARIPSGPTLQQMLDSFNNYCNFLNIILTRPKPIALELPDQWLWELVDEFIYQFQAFSQYRSKLNTKNEAELKVLTDHHTVWNVLCVLNVLHSLVDKSNIKRQLEVQARGGDPESVAGEFGQHSLYRMLGYFSLVGLLRLHSLLGDYYQAIKVLENIELNKKSQFSQVPACQISTAYYVGFAYMMMRRYSDAIRTFSSILLFIHRTKQLFQTNTYQNNQINKQTDKMYYLLVICLVLHPQCIDESIQQVLREKKYHDKMLKMHCGDEKEFKSCFLMACPKFLSPTPPSITAEAQDYSKEATEHQTQIFMDEVNQQKMLPTIRSYLKLYTTLPLSKLATFMMPPNEELTEQKLQQSIEDLRTHLLCFKHKMKNIVWTKGPSGLEGSFQSGSELDFYIDQDMIHIADTKVANRYGDFFIRKILKFEELNRKLHSIKI